MRSPSDGSWFTARACALATIAALLAVAGIVAAPSLHAQQTARMGIIAGPNFATLEGLDDVDLDKRTGSMGGLSFVLPFGSTFALQPEALLVTSGAEPRTGSDEGLRLTYAQIPVLLRITPAASSPLSPHVYVGPYFGLRISCTIDIGGTDGDCDEFEDVNTETVDLGGIVGGGLDLNLGGLIITGGLRYGFGVSKVAEFDTEDVRESARNGSFAVYGGLSIPFGRR
jgi:hypothetical protein